MALARNPKNPFNRDVSGYGGTGLYPEEVTNLPPWTTGFGYNTTVSAFGNIAGTPYRSDDRKSKQREEQLQGEQFQRKLLMDHERAVANKKEEKIRRDKDARRREREAELRGDEYERRRKAEYEEKNALHDQWKTLDQQMSTTERFPKSTSPPPPSQYPSIPPPAYNAQPQSQHKELLPLYTGSPSFQPKDMRDNKSPAHSATLGFQTTQQGYEPWNTGGSKSASRPSSSGGDSIRSTRSSKSAANYLPQQSNDWNAFGTTAGYPQNFKYNNASATSLGSSASSYSSYSRNPSAIWGSGLESNNSSVSSFSTFNSNYGQPPPPSKAKGSKFSLITKPASMFTGGKNKNKKKSKAVAESPYSSDDDGYTSRGYSDDKSQPGLGLPKRSKKKNRVAAVLGQFTGKENKITGPPPPAWRQPNPILHG